MAEGADPGAEPSQGGAGSSPWTPYRVGVLGLCVVVVTWRAFFVSRWSWADDDWVYLSHTQSMSFWDYLFQKYNGHLMPAEFLVHWVLTALAPLDFTPVVVVVAVTSGLSTWLWSRAVAALAGERLVLVVPQALLALSPLLIHPVNWWASALQVLPLQVCAAWMFLAAARSSRTGSRRDLLHMVGALVVGLAFWEKSILLVLPAAAVLLHRTPGGLMARLRRQARPLAALAGVAAVYLVGFVAFVSTRPDSGRTDIGVSLSAYRSPGEIAGFFWRGFADLLAPALLGGPWGTLPTPATIFDRPPLVVSTLSALVVLGVAAWSARRVQGAWLPLGTVVVYTAVSWGLVLYSARFELQGSSVVNQERYLADGLLVVHLAGVLLYSSPRRPRTRVPRLRPRSPRARVRALTVVLAVSLVVGNVWGVVTLGVQPGRAWVDRVTAEVHRRAPVAVLDAYAPDDVLPPAYWSDDALLSRLLSPLPGVTFDGPADQLWSVGDDGRLHRLEVDVASRSADGPVADCGYSVEAGGSQTARMSVRLFALDWLVQVDTLAAQGGTLLVDLGDRTESIAVGPGLSQHQFAYRGEVGRSVRLSMSPDSGTVCVIGVEIGNPQITDE